MHKIKKCPAAQRKQKAEQKAKQKQSKAKSKLKPVIMASPAKLTYFHGWGLAEQVINAERIISR